MNAIFLRFDSQADMDKHLPTPAEGEDPPAWIKARDNVADVIEPTGYDVPLEKQFRTATPVKGRVSWEPPPVTKPKAGDVLVKEVAKVFGYHVNLVIEGELPEELRPFQVFPKVPMRVYAGME